jgi:hypothetical protein
MQPNRQSSLDIAVNQQVVGRVSQGQLSTFFITPGVATQIIAKKNGVAGFFNDLIGSSSSGCAGTVSVFPSPGEVIRLEIGWRVNGCCSSKYHPYLQRVTS